LVSAVIIPQLKENQSMSNELSQSALKFQKTLQEMGYMDLRVVEMPDTTRTAVDAARAVDCEVGQIVKSLIFMTRDSLRPILVETSGANRVNENTISRILGETIVKADADFSRLKTGYVIGGIPPTGHNEQIITFIDEDLMNYEEIWAAAGTPRAVFKLTPPELQKMTSGRITSIK
jgi:prolyl-tRNA editing enzyme YbaK/EbsC (Cys-tRNA(Pro) deacylase)